MKKQELKLCPECPLLRGWRANGGWLQEAIKRIKQREYIKTSTPPSSLKICMELRRIMKEQGLGACPHFDYGFSEEQNSRAVS